MKAVLFQSKNEALQIKEVEMPTLNAGQVLVHLKYAALNHLDLLIWDEQMLNKPVIPGSDGSGIVHAVVKEEDDALVGKEVIINPSLYWGLNEKMYGNDYQILGNPTNGTFAEYIAIPVEYVHEKPVHLSLKEAAALPLAALTAYRALFTKANITSSDKVLLTGIGGGVALYMLQMAIAAGASVYVTSSSEEKLQSAITLGATNGFNYKNENWVKEAKALAGGFDVIIDSAGGNGFTQLTEVANDAARIVLFGRTAGNINGLKPGVIYNKQLQIMGSVMGTQNEFTSMLQFYRDHTIHPVIDKIFSINNIVEARQYLESGNQFGKVLIEID